MNNIKKAYEELFEAANNSKGYCLNKGTVFFNQLSHFVGMKGRKYDQQKIKLLVVGRAVNGWGQLKVLSSAKEFSNEASKIFADNSFDWVVYDEDKGTLRNDYLENDKYYWLNNSPFWRTVKRIWMSISNNQNFKDCGNDKWVDYIAWTNLYKVAPRDTGNPTTAMAKNQLSACKSILKAEIENLSPTHILFVTGYEGWFESFKDIFDIDFCNIKKNEYRGENKNLNFVEASGITLSGVKVVVACRPEFRDEALYAEDVINTLKL